MLSLSIVSIFALVLILLILLILVYIILFLPLFKYLIITVSDGSTHEHIKVVQIYTAKLIVNNTVYIIIDIYVDKLGLIIK